MEAEEGVANARFFLFVVCFGDGVEAGYCGVLGGGVEWGEGLLDGQSDGVRLAKRKGDKPPLHSPASLHFRGG